MTRSSIKNLAPFITLAALVLTLLACNHTPQVTDDDINLIDDIGLVDLLKEQAGVVIVDVRPDYRYRLAHIPNAISIPLPDLKSNDPRFAKAQHVVVYGDGPRNALSQAGAKKLLTNAKLAVSDFRGGMELWQQNNHKTESSN